MLLAVVTLMVVEPEPLTEVGLKLALVPLGRPLMLKPTVPVKLFKAETLTP